MPVNKKNLPLIQKTHSRDPEVLADVALDLANVNIERLNVARKHELPNLEANGKLSTEVTGLISTIINDIKKVNDMLHPKNDGIVGTLNQTNIQMNFARGISEKVLTMTPENQGQFMEILNSAIENESTPISA